MINYLIYYWKFWYFYDILINYSYNNTESVSYNLGKTMVSSVFKNYKYEVDYFNTILSPAIGSTLIGNF
jgi:hypothetical protein